MAENRGREWTILELVNWTSDYLRSSGIEEPRLNAELLLASVLGKERIMLYAYFDQVVGRAERSRFREMVKQRASGCPLQYVLGRQEFFERNFRITRDVMVPRPETELVVEACLEKIKGEGSGQWAVDVGTGSGVIAVTLAAERPGLRVIATDRSERAVDVASENAKRHAVAQRVAFGCGELIEPARGILPAGRSTVELIASNPPYIPTEQIQELQPEVRDHEPRAALDGGLDGLNVVRAIISQASDFLSAPPGPGWLVLELGEGQAEPAMEILRKDGRWDLGGVEFKRDAAGCDRVLSVRRS